MIKKKKSKTSKKREIQLDLQTLQKPTANRLTGE